MVFAMISTSFSFIFNFRTFIFPVHLSTSAGSYLFSLFSASLALLTWRIRNAGTPKTANTTQLRLGSKHFVISAPASMPNGFLVQQVFRNFFFIFPAPFPCFPNCVLCVHADWASFPLRVYFFPALFLFIQFSFSIWPSRSVRALISHAASRTACK